MTGRVGVIEPHPFLSQMIDVWRFVECTAITAHIAPSEIIDEEKDNIGFPIILFAQSNVSKKRS